MAKKLRTLIQDSFSKKIKMASASPWTSDSTSESTNCSSNTSHEVSSRWPERKLIQSPSDKSSHEERNEVSSRRPERKLIQSTSDKSSHEESMSSFCQTDKPERDLTSLQTLMKLSEEEFQKLVTSCTNHTDLTQSLRESKPHGPDPYHVFLPFYPKKGSMERWNKIKRELFELQRGSLFQSRELEDVILRYNESYKGKWDFQGLHYFFNEMDAVGNKVEILEVVTKMAKLAFHLETLVPVMIPFLKRREDRSIALSKEQIACLLAHAFFCTFPMRNAKAGREKPSTFLSSSSLPLPSINFSSLFKPNDPVLTYEKLRCIFHYFKRVTDNKYEPKEKIIFKRQTLPYSKRIVWDKSRTRFTKLHVTINGQIEQETGFLQVDFANRFIGGGVIGQGCVQEEIWFLKSPELIVSRLFTEALDDNEVLIITGSELYSEHKGYSYSFQWTGDHTDRTESNGRVKKSQIVAMDARKFNYHEEQFEENAILRELNKAYCAFYSEHKISCLPAISTGNWGCGAFGGDKHLKSLIQMMAAAEACRDVHYITYGDKTLCEEMDRVYKRIMDHNLTVGEVYRMIMNYVAYQKKAFPSQSLFHYILDRYRIVDDSENKERELPMESSV